MISIHKHSDLILNPFRIQFKLYMILYTHTQTQGAVKRHVVCVCVCVRDRHRCPLQPLFVHSHALSIPPWVIFSHTLRKTHRQLFTQLLSFPCTSKSKPAPPTLHTHACATAAALFLHLCLPPKPHMWVLLLNPRGVTRPNPMANMSYVLLLWVQLRSYLWSSATSAFQLTVTHLYNTL